MASFWMTLPHLNTTNGDQCHILIHCCYTFVTLMLQVMLLSLLHLCMSLLHLCCTLVKLLITSLLRLCCINVTHSVAFCVVFTMWHFIRSSHCGILSGIRYLHVILKQNFSFCGYNHTRKYVHYMMKFRIN